MISEEIENYTTDPLLQDIFDKVTPKVPNLTDDQSVLSYTADKSRNVFGFVGSKVSVNKVKANFYMEVSKAEELIKSESVQKKEVIRNIAAFQLNFLESTGFFEKMIAKHSLSSFTGDLPKKCAVIEGLPTDIHAALQEMYDLLDKIDASKRCAVKAQSFLKILQNESAEQTIKNELRKNQIEALWTVDGKSIIIHSNSKASSEAVLKCIEELIWTSRYPSDRSFDEQEKELLASDLWAKEKARILQSHQPLQLDEMENFSALVMFGLQQNQNSVTEDIPRFFEENTKRSLVVKGEGNRIHFLEQFRSKRISDLQSDHGVRILISGKSEGFEITGSRDNIMNCKRALMEEHDSICRAIHVVSSPAIIQHINEESGFLMASGLKAGCLVVHYSEANISTESPQDRDQHQSQLKNGSICQVRMDDITTVRADAIVNPSNGGLSHGGGLAEAIIKKGNIIN